MKNVVLCFLVNEQTKIKEEFTIEDYNKLVEAKNQEALSRFIYYRLHDRYVKPFLFNNADYKRDFKHGFAMMASACLLIETLSSFQNGWVESSEARIKGADIFDNFFKNSNKLKEFAKLNFYKHIRCGILHQGETSGGFTIRRDGDVLKNNQINAFLFLNEIENELKKYSNDLKSAAWDSEAWDNFRVKMRGVIKHCQATN